MPIQAIDYITLAYYNESVKNSTAQKDKTPAMTPQDPTTSKPRVRFLGGTRYVVESKSQPGLGRQVDTLALRCSCPAGRHGRRCWHLITALAYEEWRRRQHAQGAASSAREAGMAALQEAV